MNKKKIRRVCAAAFLFAACLCGMWTEHGIKARAAVPDPEFVVDGLVVDDTTLAAGTQKTVAVSGAEEVTEATWSTSDASVIALQNESASGVTLTAGERTGTVTLTYQYKYSDETLGTQEGSIAMQVAVSDPQLAESEVWLSVKSASQTAHIVTLTGLSANSQVEASEDTSAVYAYCGGLSQNALDGSYYADIIIGATGAKTTTVTVTADGKTLTIHVIALSLSFNRISKTVGDRYSNVYVNGQKAVFDEEDSMLALYNGSSATIKLSGSGSYAVNWSSSKSSVATVSGSGTKAVVKGRGKNGYATITATVAGKLTVSYTVGVAKKAAIQTLLRGEKVAGAKYSQARRMSSGYYDCSSFIWRMYRKSGVKFGVSSGWAPTAATEAYYATSHYKILSYSTYDESKLLPGDILFYSSKKNGRFMNITHVAMYIKPGTRIDAHVYPSYHVGERESTAEDVVLAVRPTSGTTKKVTSLKTTSVGKTSVKLSWSPANSVSGYKVYRYNASKGKWVLYKKLGQRKDAVKIGGLSSGTTYKFKVCAYKGSHNYTGAKLTVTTK